MLQRKFPGLNIFSNPGIIISVGINKRPWISKFMSYNVIRTAGLKLTAILVQGPWRIPPLGGGDRAIGLTPAAGAADESGTKKQ